MPLAVDLNRLPNRYRNLGRVQLSSLPRRPQCLRTAGDIQHQKELTLEQLVLRSAPHAACANSCVRDSVRQACRTGTRAWLRECVAGGICPHAFLFACMLASCVRVYVRG